MEELFQLLAVVQILIGLYLIVHALQWRGYARRRMLTDPGFYAPKTAVLCPCKGVEPGLDQNLNALCEFNHKNYEVFFIVATESDPALSVVKRVIAQARIKAHLVIAGIPEGCAEKVNNLRAAIEQLPEDFEVLVFADSDGRPGKGWLQRMVGPLGNSKLGATTTMRWFIPKAGNVASLLLAAWNAPVVTMLGENRRNFCWGGGTAIRRSIFEHIRVLDEWRGSVSDDYSLTIALERSNYPIQFLPECLTASFVQTDFAGLLEFSNRQMIITRKYSHKMWTTAFATHVFFCFTVLLGVWLTLGKVVATLPALGLAALTFFPLLLAAIRGALRAATVADLLPAYRPQIVAQSWVYVVVGVFVPFLYILNFLASLATRKIYWRGVRYEVISPQQTRILSS